MGGHPSPVALRTPRVPADRFSSEGWRTRDRSATLVLKLAPPPAGCLSPTDLPAPGSRSQSERQAEGAPYPKVTTLAPLTAAAAPPARIPAPAPRQNAGSRPPPSPPKVTMPTPPPPAASPTPSERTANAMCAEIARISMIPHHIAVFFCAVSAPKRAPRGRDAYSSSSSTGRLALARIFSLPAAGRCRSGPFPCGSCLCPGSWR